MRSLVTAALVLAASPAAAGVSGLRLSELATASSTGDPAARYVELEATAEACVFPSTELVAFDAAGAVVGRAAPFTASTCFPPGRFLLLATPAAQVAFATGAADAALVPPLPALAGQLCLVSSTTRYDCVRWGVIASPVRDLFGPDDATAAFGPPAGLALARRADTGVVADDWRVEAPSPRRPNDGAPWDQGDAGLDAAPPLDAPTDAASPDAALLDGPGPDAPDARSDRYLDLDPGGGAPCGCGASGGQPGGLALLIALGLLRRRGGRAPPADGRGGRRLRHPRR